MNDAALKMRRLGGQCLGKKSHPLKFKEAPSELPRQHPDYVHWDSLVTRNIPRTRQARQYPFTITTPPFSFKWTQKSAEIYELHQRMRSRGFHLWSFASDCFRPADVTLEGENRGQSGHAAVRR
jgi:hypothetical protein